MLDLLPAELRDKVELVKVTLEKLVDGIYVLGFHLSKPLRGGLVRKSVFANLECRLTVGRARAEANLIEFLPVDGPMVISTRADRLREHDTSCVDGLPNPIEITQPRDLLDQHRCEPLISELLVHNHEVDLGSFYDFIANADLHRYGRNEGT